MSACANKNPVFEEKLPDNTLKNQVEISTADDSLPKSDNHSVETEPQLNDCSVKIGDVSLSLSESRKDILAKLDDTCVRIRLQKFHSSACNPQTVRGLHPRDTYSQMTDLYGDEYETHAYAGKEIYTIYRYSVGDCICEFGISGENSEDIYNIDVYLPNQFPIYEYGEESISGSSRCFLEQDSTTVPNFALRLILSCGNLVGVATLSRVYPASYNQVKDMSGQRSVKGAQIS